MFDRKKYVIFDYCVPILFTEAHTHNQFQYMGNITSAGFVNIEPVRPFDEKNCCYDELIIKASCYGKSTSLNIASDPENDKKIIEKFLNK